MISALCSMLGAWALAREQDRAFYARLERDFYRLREARLREVFPRSDDPPGPSLGMPTVNHWTDRRSID